MQNVSTRQLAAWADDLSRRAPLARQDGVLVQGGDPRRRYLATIRGYETNRYQLSPELRGEITRRWQRVIQQFGYGEDGATGETSSRMFASAQNLSSESLHLKAEVEKFLYRVRAV